MKMIGHKAAPSPFRWLRCPFSWTCVFRRTCTLVATGAARLSPTAQPAILSHQVEGSQKQARINQSTLRPRPLSEFCDSGCSVSCPKQRLQHTLAVQF
eukprot:2311725-Amphidinium_carterae.1